MAVLTYLRHVFESIDHPDLVRLTVQYLFGIREQVVDHDESKRPLTAIRRRKSADLIAHLAETDDQPSPDLFNLADLISASLRSSSQQTVNATLLLLSTMLRRQQHQVSSFLFRTRNVRSSDKRRTVGGQEKEIDNFLTLAENLTRFQDLESSYENYLYDNRTTLEVHSCSMQLLTLPSSTSPDQNRDHGPMEKLVRTHALSTDDPMLRNIIVIMEKFFQNDIESNLSATRVLIDLASCIHMRLEGWLLTDPSKYWFSDDETLSANEEEDQAAVDGDLIDKASDMPSQLRQMALARRVPSWGASALSPVFKTLDTLVRQVETFRQDINDFDKYLLECRNIVETTHGASSSHGHSTPSRAFDSPRISPTRAHPLGPIGSITERLRTDRFTPIRPSAPLADPSSRTASPRGRQLDSTTTPSLVSRLTYLAVAPARTASASSAASSRDYSPSPLRSDGPVAATPPRLLRSMPAASATLRAAISIPVGGKGAKMEVASETSSVRSTSTSVDGEAGTGGGRQVALGYLLTNVIVLQEFILELAALVEVRATMFGEVRYL